MTYIIPLPASVRDLVNKHRAGAAPSLMLDKYLRTWDPQATGGFSEGVQREALADVAKQSQAAPHGLNFGELLARRGALLAAVGAARFTATALGPLTLHLSRASALENAGICLHPLYGFVYLPGSGVKGVARAYAETVWFPTRFRAADGQPADDDQLHAAAHAWETIEAVFGWAPGSDGKKRWKPKRLPPRGDGDRSSAGQIVFHDAWPAQWPKLLVDIVNNHHPAYYGADAKDNVKAPGDWENPVPVYFLAVAPDTTFEFALSKRRDDAPDHLLDLARQWLAGALCELGAGAKTAAGYGAFKVASHAETAAPQSTSASPANLRVASSASPRRRSFTTTLELVTPAFLAGANQKPEDCDLRSATLRGLLRWWWRTLHAGHVDVATLRRMEAAIWGDTQHGSPVRIVVEPDTEAMRFPRPGRNLEQGEHRSDDDFLRKNNIELASGRSTQGLFYAAYGTDEMAREQGNQVRRQRQCIAEKSQWHMRVDARQTIVCVSDGKRTRDETIDAAMIEEQASAALWLLCHFGGVGAKSRKGFGSLALRALPAELKRLDLGMAQTAAKHFRDRWLQLRLPFTPGATGTHALERMSCIEQATTWTNPWFALDQVGAVMQAFAQAPAATGHGKHCGAKAVLGLPRQIHGPRSQPLRGQDASKWQRPNRLRGPEGDRHAAPIFYHFDRDQNGFLIARVAVFDADRLWDATGGSASAPAARADAARALQALEMHLRSELAARVAQHRAAGQAPVYVPGHKRGAGQSTPKAALPAVGDLVEATLLEQRTRSGGWRARHVNSGIAGPIVNSRDVPEAIATDQPVLLVVQAIASNQKEISFRYQKPGEQATVQKKQSPQKGKGHPRGGQRYGRR